MSEPILIARKLDDGLYVSIEHVNELKAKLKAENESLKAKLENVYDAVAFNSLDTLKRERRLQRALYKACANWADVEVFERTVGIDNPNVEANRWALMRNKCLKKAEEYR